MAGLRALSAYLAERGFPFLLALQCFLGSLQLFDALSVVYYPMVHRATSEVRFELGFGLVVPLLVLLVLWLGWVVWMRRFEALLFPAVGLFVYPFMGLEASVSIASLLAGVFLLLGELESCFCL